MRISVWRVVAVAALAVFLMASLLTAGCGIIAEQVAEKAVEESTGVKVDADEDQMTITTEDGETLEVDAEGADLPDGFPSDVPVYDADIEGSTSFSSGEGQNFSIALVTTDSFDDVVDWYKSEFESKGWESVGETVANVDGDSTAVLAYEKGDVEASVTIGEDSENGGILNIIHTVFLP